MESGRPISRPLKDSGGLGRRGSKAAEKKYMDSGVTSQAGQEGGH